MNDPSPRHNFVPPFASSVIVRALALGLVYAGLSRAVTVVAAFGGSQGTTFWPAAGVTVAFLLWRPRREWCALLAAVWAAEFSLNYGVSHLDANLSAGWAFANIVEPLVAALLLTRGGRPAPNIARSPDLVRFVGYAVLIGPALGSLIGAGTGALTGFYDLVPALPRWFVGDAIGALVLAPVTLTFLQGRLRNPAAPRAMRIFPALVAAGTVATLLPGEVWWGIALPYLIVPILVLAALKTGPPGAVLGVAVVGVVVNAATAAGYGPFSLADEIAGLVEAQAFLALSAFTALIVASLTADLIARDEAERMKNTFIETIAHDLRGPIGTIQGFVEFLELHGDGIDDSERLQILARIRLTGDRMLRLVGDVLDLQRLAGSPESNRRVIDVSERVRDAVAHVSPGDRTVQVDAPPLMAEVDPLGIDRIIDNLVSNAVRFAPADTTICVSVAPSDEGIVICVDDEGAGVPDSNKALIFRPFEQAGSVGGGMGVGLALVREFAAMHGGRAWVQDRPGGGSSFRVLLAVEPIRPEGPTNEGQTNEGQTNDGTSRASA